MSFFSINEYGTRFPDIVDHFVLNDKLILRNFVGNDPEELWSSDGTTAGTIKIKTWPVRAGGSSAAIGNTLYLVANDGIHGNEVWKTDGTTAGTSLVADLRTGDEGDRWTSPQDIRSFGVFRDTLYISAMDENGHWALFKTNGNNPGVTKVLNIDQVESSVVLGEELLLFTNHFDLPFTGYKTMLWSTEGTADGTELLQELDLDLVAYNAMFSHQVVNGVLYFSTMEGGRLWRTDGTTCGTFVVDIGSSGAFPIDTLNFNLIFGSYDAQAGYEPHAYNLAEAPGNPCGNAMAIEMTSLQGSHEKILTGYPNPFNNEFALRINGKTDESAHLRVFTLFGTPVEDIGEVKANTEHRIGQQWRPGVYVLQVVRRGETSKYMLVKE